MLSTAETSEKRGGPCKCRSMLSQTFLPALHACSIMRQTHHTSDSIVETLYAYDPSS